ncbi:hypothetical protein CXF83_03725 [Shewanella sp. Choline-02u-19]|uniref:hypothetical protein n=1 Tax=unclassified Shewanella TaxID=196818 RepID=UPI000C33FB26|nr:MULTISPECIES: hypothetical protein [unclassified Shewanella]PKG56726.1 hypothetical protein CXF82_13425 [Shewanella sp. GutDb-MelDb]PKG74365.1 hypothetical protein CXF86_12685 [Shewanella sp. GutCb]PKH57809.1 hypothetical protein CXF84_07455 [Shewanella sp. Bg11-22]PKI29774.1 hypothetical protein CXF83_03725 [Shewanella sp. Choline-02u-19]
MKAIILILCSLLVTPVWANTYVVGDPMETLKLQDQYEADYAIDSTIKHVLFSRSMDGGTLIQTALEEQPELYKKGDLAYVADISGMPSLIARFVAIPQFKQFAYRVALDRDGEITKALPAQKDQVTLIQISDNKITQISYFDSAESLLEALK